MASYKETLSAKDVGTVSVGKDGKLNLKNGGKNAAEDLDWDEPEEWLDKQTGFPPYWNAEEGEKFMGKVELRDDRDPEFVRYVVRATRPIKCFRGDAENKEELIVRPGEFFSLSLYNNLQLDQFIGMGEIFVKCTGQIKAKTPTGYVWGFKVKVSPDTQKRLDARDAQNPLLESGDAGL